MTQQTDKAAAIAEANARYKALMDQMSQAMQATVLMMADITDEDLAWVDKTIGLADTMSIFYVSGAEFPAAMDRLAQQRHLLSIVRKVRAQNEHEHGPRLNFEEEAT